MIAPVHPSRQRQIRRSSQTTLHTRVRVAIAPQLPFFDVTMSKPRYLTDSERAKILEFQDMIHYSPRYQRISTRNVTQKYAQGDSSGLLQPGNRHPSYIARGRMARLGNYSIVGMGSLRDPCSRASYFTIQAADQL